MGAQKYGGEPVCAETGGACKWDQRAPLPFLSTRATAIWRLWALSQTQWQMGPMGPTGLLYSGVAVVAASQGMSLDDETLRFIQRLETARLAFIAAKAEEADEKKGTK